MSANQPSRVAAADAAAMRAWGAAKRYRALTIAGAATVVVAAYLGYPWTHAQCVKQVASMPTINGVALYRSTVCDPMDKP